MKTRLIFLVTLIFCFACGTNNKPVSDAQKEKIIGEVKEVVNTIVKGAEEANLDMVIGTCLDSPDFVFLYNGNPFSYQQFVELGKSMFSTLINQKVTILDEKYVVLDNSNVLYTANSKWVMNFKDGHAILEDPWAMQYLFKKVDNMWKAISINESGVEQSVKNTENPNQLNQVELFKQFIGSWKADVGKDTTYVYDYKSYGTGLDINYKAVTKGKNFLEAKILWGYDKSLDKYIIFYLPKGLDMEMFVGCFVSKTNFEMLPYSDISNPDKASFKMEGEFKSPDTLVFNWIQNNKTTSTEIYARIK